MKLRCVALCFAIQLSACTEENQVVQVAREAEFYEGLWQSACVPSDSVSGTSSYKIIQHLEYAQGTWQRYQYTDAYCVIGESLASEGEFRLRMGKQVITSDGLKATELDFIFADETVHKDIAHRLDDVLYFGLNSSTVANRQSQLNFAMPYSLLSEDAI